MTDDRKSEFCSSTEGALGVFIGRCPRNRAAVWERHPSSMRHCILGPVSSRVTTAAVWGPPGQPASEQPVGETAGRAFK